MDRHILAFNQDGSIYGPADPEMRDPSGDWSDVESILENGGHLELWVEDRARETRSLTEAIDFLKGRDHEQA